MIRQRGRFIMLVLAWLSVCSIASVRAHPVTTATAQLSLTNKVYVPIAHSQLPGRVEVNSATVYLYEENGSTSAAIVGELVNLGGTTVYDVYVYAYYYDAQGNVLHFGGGYNWFHAQRPGEPTPFMLSQQYLPNTVARVEITLMEDGGVPSGQYERLSVLSSTVRAVVTPDGTYATVAGEVRNDSRSVLRDTRVGVALYDAEGVVVDVGLGRTTNATDPGDIYTQLVPGAVTGYDIEQSIGAPFVAYTIHTEGRVERTPAQGALAAMGASVDDLPTTPPVRTLRWQQEVVAAQH